MDWKRPHIRRDIGVQHRPDDVSRVPSKRTSISPPVLTAQGNIIPEVDPSEYFALQIARRVREIRQLLTANVALNVDFDSTCIGLEVIVLTVTPAISVGVGFGGDIASIPANSNVLANTSEVRSGEARFYDVKTDKVSLITSAATAAIRMTVLLP